MATGTFDVTDLTWNGKEIQQLSEGVFEEVFELPSLNEFHEIRTGIKAKEQIAIFGLLGLVGTAGGADCSIVEDTNDIPASEKFWDPKQVDVRLSQCVKDLIPSFNVWATKNGIDKNDLTGGDWLMFVQERLSFSLEEAVLRIAWFNDTAAALSTASPAGVITSTATIGYFNVIDGLWKQIFTNVASELVLGVTRRFTITENALGTSALQYVLAAGKALAVYRGMEQGADIRLRKQPDKVIISTQSLYDNYVTYLESQAVSPSFERLESGFEVLRFRGTIVIPFDFWDRHIFAYEDNGTTHYRPHRALLTVPENIQIGLEDENVFQTFLVWYEKKDKKNYIDVEFSIDAKLIQNYLFQVAY